MKPNQLIVATCTVVLLILTACGGGSSGTAVNDVVMFKYLGYNIAVQNSFQETLSKERSVLAQREIFVKKEVCGDWNDGPTAGPAINYFVTISETQADLAKSIGYEKYMDDGKYNFHSCN